MAASFPRKNCGVLGCTGSVGQRFILLLALHPHFKVHAIGASARSAGKRYKDAVRWKQNVPMSKELGDLMVKECKAEEFQGCDLIFSGLDSDVAGDVGWWFLIATKHAINVCFRDCFPQSWFRCFLKCEESSQRRIGALGGAHRQHLPHG